MSKLKRLGNVYDLPTEVKVIEGEDGGVGEDVGIRGYVAASSNEHELISGPKLTEREAIPDNGPADPVHPHHLPHVPPTTINHNKLREASEWAHKEAKRLEAIEKAARFKEYERLSALARKKSKEGQLPQPNKEEFRQIASNITTIVILVLFASVYV